jgi:hypothetical protein
MWVYVERLRAYVLRICASFCIVYILLVRIVWDVFISDKFCALWRGICV